MKIKTLQFTLLEIILVIGILAVFMYTCSNVLINTLETRNLLEKNYSYHRTDNIGWHILYEDLANAVGVYYLQTTNWQGPPDPKKKAPPKGSKTKKEDAKKPGNKFSADELFLFATEYNFDSPFLEVVVSKGRVRINEEDTGLGFRKVKYYISSHPEPDNDGDILLRTEEPWEESGKKGSEEESDFEEAEFDLESEYKKFAVLENFRSMEAFVYHAGEWIEEWSSLQSGDLPLAIKIEYELLEETEDDFFERTEPLNKIIPVPLSYQIVTEPQDSIQ